MNRNRSLCNQSCGDKQLIVNFRSSNNVIPINPNARSMILIGQQIDVISTDYILIYYLPWYISAFPNTKQARLFFEASITDSALDMQLVNQSNNTVIGFVHITSNGFHELQFDAPTNNSRLALSVKKTLGSVNPQIYGIGLRTIV